jgi:predicted nucleotidyltransferase
MGVAAKAAQRWLNGAVRRIARKAKPEKIILFGSRARGRPRWDSDFDLLVVMQRPANWEKRYKLVDNAIGDHLWPVDLLVYRPDEIAHRLSIGDSFFSEVLRRGRVLYES